MKNFEKYEKEIKKAIHTNCTADIITKLMGTDTAYLPDMVDWLYENYKEPLLTNEEKEYLSNVIKPFSSIICIDFSKTECTIHYTKDKKHSWFSIPNIFKNMQNVNGTREYSLKELGL